MRTKSLIAAVIISNLIGHVDAQIVINEIESDTFNTPTTDYAEFIELYSLSGGATPLDGLTLVLFNGNGDVSYAVIDLDGFSTDSSGFFVLGTSSTFSADNTSLLGVGNLLQNGPDAVALYLGDATAFPNGTIATTSKPGRCSSVRDR